MTRIVCISDTHTYQKKMVHSIPDGDVLIHAGDFMSSGWDQFQYIPFLHWFSEQPHKHKVFIAGNHDRYTEMYPKEFKNDVKSFKNIIYLCDEEIVIDGIKIYGSPWQRWFYDWAWNFPRDIEKYKEKAKIIWDNIPIDTQILITHGHPYGINDKAPDGELTGCKILSSRISELKNLKLYVGGHIHCEHGLKNINNITYVNASICTESYEPLNPPIVVDIDF